MNDKQRIREETGFVYSRGLVALSLFGNRFIGEGMEDFCDIMRKNYWLLGKYYECYFWVGSRRDRS